MAGWRAGQVKAGSERGEVIEEPRPEGQPSPICIQGKGRNIHTAGGWMNKQQTADGTVPFNSFLIDRQLNMLSGTLSCTEGFTTLLKAYLY